jgi:hypothetical protein
MLTLDNRSSDTQPAITLSTNLAADGATTAATARLSITQAGNATFSGFTSLGTGNTGIKVAVLSGTTGATEGSTVTAAHGVTVGKIVGVSCIVFDAATSIVTEGYVPGGGVAGYQFNVSVSSGNVNVANHATSSENILSDTFKCLVTYVE